MKITKLFIITAALFFMPLFYAGTAGAAECDRQPLPPALDALNSSSEVDVSTVEVANWGGIIPAKSDDNIYYLFTPRNTVPKTCFIILPGGNCDPRSYAPAAHAIAAKGFMTCIVPMPNCVAMPTGYNRADRVVKDHPEIEKWVIGGHSVGGTAAGFYAKQNSSIRGVVIWASLVAASNRLQKTTIKVLDVHGSLDGRATPEAVIENAKYLPKDAVLVEIEGGNHTQFGYIDPSPGTYLEDDNAATITIEDQQEQIVQATADFLKQFDNATTIKPGACPLKALFSPEQTGLLSIYYKFRDSILTQTEAGRHLRALYYKHGAEVSQILAARNELNIKAQALALGLAPDMFLGLYRDHGLTISRIQYGQIVDFIVQLKKTASPALQSDLAFLLAQLSDGGLQRELGYRIR